MKQHRRFVFIAAAVLFTGASARAGTLTIEDYLQQVEGGNDGLQGARKTAEGALERKGEGNLLFMPVLSLSGQYAKDEKEQVFPAASGDRSTRSTYTLGITEVTPFGLSARLGYTMVNSNLHNAVALPLQEFTDVSPSVDLTFSLWRNFLGAETRATRDLTNAQAALAGHGANYQAALTVAQAEGTYWQLAAARETVAGQREALAAAERLRTWNAERVKSQLADEAELLQAEAALAARRLELQTAVDLEAQVSRLFNSTRGIDRQEVPETLELPPVEKITGFTAPSRKAARADVLAAQAQSRLAEASARLGRERYKPNLEVFSTLSLNGHDGLTSDAVEKGFTMDYPANTIGVRLTLPLDLWGTGAVRSGYSLEEEGAEQTFQRKLQDGEREWRELNLRMTESRQRAVLSGKLETAQRRKLEHERDRLKRGRTTTFQVLLFEQDYAASRLARIRAQSDALAVITQMKTFAEGGDL